MAVIEYRQIEGTFYNFFDNKPYAYGKLKFKLSKNDYMPSGVGQTPKTFPISEIYVGLNENGEIPAGFQLWCNSLSSTGSHYQVTEPDGTTWTFVLPNDEETPIKLEDLRIIGQSVIQTDPIMSVIENKVTEHSDVPASSTVLGHIKLSSDFILDVNNKIQHANPIVKRTGSNISQYQIPYNSGATENTMSGDSEFTFNSDGSKTLKTRHLTIGNSSIYYPQLSFVDAFGTQVIQTYSGSFYTSNRFEVGGYSGGGQFCVISNVSSRILQFMKMASGQTADILRIQKNDGHNLIRLTKDGVLHWGGGAYDVEIYAATAGLNPKLKTFETYSSDYSAWGDVNCYFNVKGIGSYFPCPNITINSYNTVLNSVFGGYVTIGHHPSGDFGTNGVALKVRGATAQAANLVEFVTYQENVMSAIGHRGQFKLASMTDAQADNNSFYYSTTQSKAVYKDPSGSVNVLY